MSNHFVEGNSSVLYLDISIYVKTRQSKQCGFSVYTFDNSKSKAMVRLVRAEKMVLSGQGGEDGLVWSGLCEKDIQDDFDSECIGYDWSP